jgi:hypothetical protein
LRVTIGATGSRPICPRDKDDVVALAIKTGEFVKRHGTESLIGLDWKHNLFSKISSAITVLPWITKLISSYLDGQFSKDGTSKTGTAFSFVTQFGDNESIGP